MKEREIERERAREGETERQRERVRGGKVCYCPDIRPEPELTGLLGYVEVSAGATLMALISFVSN